MRNALIVLATILLAAAAGWLTTRLQPGLVTGLVVLAGAAVVFAWPIGARWGDWWYWYNRYLESPRWKRLSWQVRQRDDWTCRNCGSRQETRRYRGLNASWEYVVHTYRDGPPMQAHHLPGTYRPWWWYALQLPEPKRNLVTLCRDCHEAVTQ